MSNFIGKKSSLYTRSEVVGRDILNFAEALDRSYAPRSAPPLSLGAVAGRLDVLLLDAQQRQTLTCSRVFSRAGLSVGVTACLSDAGSAPGLRTRSCDFRAVIPDVGSSPSGFVDGLLSLLDSRPADVLLPAHDGSIEAIRIRRAEVERRIALPLAPERALEVAVDKERTLALARELGIRTPRGASVRSDADVGPAIAEAGLPAVVKPTRSWVQGGNRGTRLTSVAVQTLSEARLAWDYISECGGGAEIQEWLPGKRDAVSFFMTRDDIWARFAQTSHREFPLLGGVSVLCESIPPFEDIAAPAELLVRAIGLEGCSMVEFRRDAEGLPTLMEVNPRMGGSVGLAVRCGVNFPKLMYDWAMGRPLSRVDAYGTGQRTRWLSGDIWSLKSAFDSVRGPDVPSRTSALWRFMADFVSRPGALEPFDITDPMPALVDFRGSVVHPLLRRLSRVIRRDPRTSSGSELLL